MGFLSRGKFIVVIKSEDASNFMLTLDGIGPFWQNFKNREPLKIEKWNPSIDPFSGRSCKAFFLKNNGN